MLTRENAERIIALYREASSSRWGLYAAQGWVESTWRSDLVSPRGARGIAQFMPATWAWAISMGWAPKDSMPETLEDAVPAQVRYMEWIQRQVGASDSKALAGYNWGLTRVKHAVEQFRGSWQDALPRETYAYVRQVKNCAGLIDILSRRD